MASIQVLERKIHKQMKANADQFKHFTNELQILKSSPKSKVQQPHTELSKTKKLSDLAKRAISTSKKATVQNDDEIKKKKFLDRAIPMSDGASQFSESDTEKTKIDFNGSPIAIKRSPLEVLQILILDLQEKLKDLAPDISCRLSDDKDIARNFKDINFAIKQARFNLKIDELGTKQKVKSQATQVEVGTGQNVMKSTHQQISKVAQTDVYGDDVEKLENFYNKYIQSQLDLNVDLSQIKDAFKLELNRLKSEITLLRGEINFLMGVIGETRNHNHIDKKLNDVKKKCLEATKQCLKVQLQNHFICTNTKLVAKPAGPNGNELGNQLGVIKSDVQQEISTLKAYMKHNRHHVSSSSAAEMSFDD